MADEATTCSTCGKKVRSGRAGSLTQWLFSEDSCDCDGKSVALKLPEPEVSGDSTGMCEKCGLLKSESRPGSLTQWVFSGQRCQCDLDKFQTVDQEASDELDSYVSPAFKTAVDEALIERLEQGEIEYHGLDPESFPFERYRIIAEKGRGSAGVVYEAWDCMLKKRVAIKTLYSESWSDEQLVRFQSEARSASRLSHPNLLKVLDFGCSPNGQPYMVMEFVEGITLKEMIEDRGAIPYAEALSIFFQICQGIRHAHGQGIFHRDLKSANIMFGTDNSGVSGVKIIDFGIAALAQTQSAPPLNKGEQSIRIVGSPLYISPEQINGQEFDVRSDIYSFGCVMFEVLCGNVPFEGETTMATLALHINGEIPFLKDRSTEPVDCPVALEEVVRRSLAKKPAERYQTIDEVHQRLNEVVEPVITASADASNNKNERRTIFGISPIAFVLIAAIAMTGLTVVVFTQSKPKPGVAKTVKKHKKRDDVWDVPMSPKLEQPDEALKNDPFKAIAPEGFNIQYLPSEARLTIDSNKDIDQIFERALALGKPIANLELFNVQISPRVFKLIGTLSGLKSISVTDITGPDEEAWRTVLKGCTNLRELRATDIDVTEGMLHEMAHIPDLQKVELDSSTISADGIHHLEELPKLFTLSMKTTPLTPKHIKAISHLKYLQALYVGDSGIADSDVLTITTSLVNLHTIGLNGTKISDKSLEQLLKLKKLRYLYTFRCPKLSARAVDAFQREKPGCQMLNDSNELGETFMPVE